MVKLSKRHKNTKKLDSSILESKTYLTSTLFLVDLAGSERIKKSRASGDRLHEAKAINSSLSALGKCIHALTELKSSFIPFRDSKLTRLLQNSLGGNCRTSLIVTIGPCIKHLEETISTLSFGLRAMKIENTPALNRQKDFYALSLQLQMELDLKDDQLHKLELSQSKLLDLISTLKKEIEDLKGRSSSLRILDSTHIHSPQNSFSNSYSNRIDENHDPEIISHYESLISKLEAEHKDFLEEIDNIMADMESESDELKSDNLQLKEKTHLLEKEIENLNHNLDKEREDRECLSNDLSTENDNLSNSLLKAKSEIENLQKKIITIESNFEKSNQELEKTRVYLSEKDEIISNLNHKITTKYENSHEKDQMKNQIELLNNRIEELEKSKFDILNENNEIENECSELMEFLENERNKNEDLIFEIENLTKDHLEYQSMKEAEIQELIDHMKSLEQEIDFKNETKIKLENRILELDDDVEILRNDNNYKDELLSDLQNKLYDRDQALKETEEEIIRLNCYIEGYEGKMKEMEVNEFRQTNNLHCLIEESENLKLFNEKNSRELIDLKNKNEKFFENLQFLELEILKLQENVGELIEKNNEKEIKSQDLEEKYLNLIGKLNLSENLMLTCENKISSLETYIHNFRLKSLGINDENIRLIESLRNLEKENYDLKNCLNNQRSKTNVNKVYYKNIFIRVLNELKSINLENINSKELFESLNTDNFMNFTLKSNLHLILKDLIISSNMVNINSKQVIELIDKSRKLEEALNLSLDETDIFKNSLQKLTSCLFNKQDQDSKSHEKLNEEIKKYKSLNDDFIQKESKLIGKLEIYELEKKTLKNKIRKLKSSFKNVLLFTLNYINDLPNVNNNFEILKIWKTEEFNKQIDAQINPSLQLNTSDFDHFQLKVDKSIALVKKISEKSTKISSCFSHLSFYCKSQLTYSLYRIEELESQLEIETKVESEIQDEFMTLKRDFELNKENMKNLQNQNNKLSTEIDRIQKLLTQSEKREFELSQALSFNKEALNYQDHELNDLKNNNKEFNDSLTNQLATSLQNLSQFLIEKDSKSNILGEHQNLLNELKGLINKLCDIQKLISFTSNEKKINHVDIFETSNNLLNLVQKNSLCFQQLEFTLLKKDRKIIKNIENISQKADQCLQRFSENKSVMIHIFSLVKNSGCLEYDSINLDRKQNLFEFDIFELYQKFENEIEKLKYLSEENCLRFEMTTHFLSLYNSKLKEKLKKSQNLNQSLNQKIKIQESAYTNKSKKLEILENILNNEISGTCSLIIENALLKMETSNINQPTKREPFKDLSGLNATSKYISGTKEYSHLKPLLRKFEFNAIENIEFNDNNVEKSEVQITIDHLLFFVDVNLESEFQINESKVISKPNLCSINSPKALLPITPSGKSLIEFRNSFRKINPAKLSSGVFTNSYKLRELQLIKDIIMKDDYSKYNIEKENFEINFSNLTWNELAYLLTKSLNSNKKLNKSFQNQFNQIKISKIIEIDLKKLISTLTCIITDNKLKEDALKQENKALFKECSYLIRKIIDENQKKFLNDSRLENSIRNERAALIIQSAFRRLNILKEKNQSIQENNTLKQEKDYLKFQIKDFNAKTGKFLLNLSMKKIEMFFEEFKNNSNNEIVF